MKFFIWTAWAIALAICTCTSELSALIYEGRISFQWISDPKAASKLAMLSDAHYWEPGWLLTKAGHFTGFMALAGIGLWWLNSVKKAFWLATGYAVLTEIVQLFVGRDGRLLDMGIDLAGISLGLLLLQAGDQAYKRTRKGTFRESH